MEDNKKVTRMLKNLKKKIATGIIPYQAMTSCDRNTSEGYNDGLRAVMKLIDNKLKSEVKSNKYERESNEGSNKYTEAVRNMEVR